MTTPMGGQQPSLSGMGAGTWDAIVVGAGPAGSMVAREMARWGGKVLLLDRQARGRWKVCGACLSPGAQEVLRRVGLGELPSRLGGIPLDTLRLGGWASSAQVALRGSLALSRSVLDAALVEEAQAQGASFRSQARVRWDQLMADSVQLEVRHPQGRVMVRSRVVVAADGIRSGIMTQAGLGVPEARPAEGTETIGLGAVFQEADGGYRPGVIHMAVGREGYVGLVRTESGKLNIGAAVRSHHLRQAGSPQVLISTILRSAGFPPLMGRPSEGWKGTPALRYAPSSLAGERLFAVGDAAGFVEPFTGEGMSWALSGAVNLAPLLQEAVVRWRSEHPLRWARLHERTIGRAQRLSRGAAWAVERPLISRVVLGILSRFPGMAGPFVRRASRPATLHLRRVS